MFPRIEHTSYTDAFIFTSTQTICSYMHLLSLVCLRVSCLSPASVSTRWLGRLSRTWGGIVHVCVCVCARTCVCVCVCVITNWNRL